MIFPTGVSLIALKIVSSSVAGESAATPITSSSGA
jgi:hypothetical protein